MARACALLLYVLLILLAFAASAGAARPIHSPQYTLRSGGAGELRQFRTLLSAAGDGSSQDSSTSVCNTFNPVFAFGDSTTDTGNAVLSDLRSYAEATLAPYGNTFFAMPTGRFSDGRLMVDFLCAANNISLLPPHLAPQADSTSENYAVAGATSLDVATLQQLAGITPTSTPDSLGVQIGWFQVDTVGTDLSSALVYLGEIGGNDYNYALAAEQAPEEIAMTLIPPVIQQVATSLDALLSSGVKKIVVQGEFPMGCMVVYLKTRSNLEHDEHGCVAPINAMSNQHNQLLREVISGASKKYPDAEIVFFDTSAAYLHILDNAAAYGFTNTQEACFPKLLRGALQSTQDIVPCPNPDNYMGWDGIHLTDAMYGAMMKLFLYASSSGDQTFASPSPNFLSAPQCASS